MGDDGKAPEAAFGVVINNNWDQDTMPRCGYDPNETVFEMTLTAEQLENNPVFTIQSQLPVGATYTVTVDGLTEDTRTALSLAPLNENVTVNTYDASDWMNGQITLCPITSARPTAKPPLVICAALSRGLTPPLTLM